MNGHNGNDAKTLGKGTAAEKLSFGTLAQNHVRPAFAAWLYDLKRHYFNNLLGGTIPSLN